MVRIRRRPYSVHNAIPRLDQPDRTFHLAHVRDDFSNPSVVRVDLRNGNTPLGVRTDGEGAYHPNDEKQLRYDPEHPGRSAFVGDSNGPTWTLGAGYVGILGGIMFGSAALIVFLTDLGGIYARSRMRDPGLGPALERAFAAPIETPNYSPPTSLQANQPIRVRRDKAFRLLGFALVPLIALGIVALRGYDIPDFLVSIILYGGCPFVFFGLKVLFENEMRLKNSRGLTWTPALALVPTVGGPAIFGTALVALDSEHAAAFVFGGPFEEDHLETDGGGRIPIWLTVWNRELVAWLPGDRPSALRPNGQWQRRIDPTTFALPPRRSASYWIGGTALSGAVTPNRHGGRPRASRSRGSKRPAAQAVPPHRKRRDLAQAARHPGRPTQPDHQRRRRLRC
jgi:hypothetical protein